jgi:hypothetical protein
MPDLLEQEVTVDPTDPTPVVNLKPIESLLTHILRETRQAHPNQRAVVKLANGQPTFPNDVSTEVIFLNEGRRVKSHLTYLTNATTDWVLWYSFDSPVTFNTPAKNAHILAHDTTTVISNEITHLYLYLTSAAPAVFAVNNSEQGGVHQIIKIDAYTNPEEALVNSEDALA